MSSISTNNLNPISQLGLDLDVVHCSVGTMRRSEADGYSRLRRLAPLYFRSHLDYFPFRIVRNILLNFMIRILFHIQLGNARNLCISFFLWSTCPGLSSHGGDERVVTMLLRRQRRQLSRQLTVMYYYYHHHQIQGNTLSQLSSHTRRWTRLTQLVEIDSEADMYILFVRKKIL